MVAMAGVWRWPGERMYGIFSEAAADSRESAAKIEEPARELARLLPASPYPWNMLGMRARAAGNLAVAKEAFGEAAARCPHRASLWASLAEVSLATGDWAGAVRAAEKAVEWSPTSARYGELLARCRAAGGGRNSP